MASSCEHSNEHMRNYYLPKKEAAPSGYFVIHRTILQASILPSIRKYVYCETAACEKICLQQAQSLPKLLKGTGGLRGTVVICSLRLRTDEG